VWDEKDVMTRDYGRFEVSHLFTSQARSPSPRSARALRSRGEVLGRQLETGAVIFARR
jgi:hypothetical protein